MDSGTSQDRLDPQLKRDLFFGDMAQVRREITYAVAVLLVFAAWMIVATFLGGPWFRLVSPIAPLVGLTAVRISRSVAAMNRGQPTDDPTGRRHDMSPFVVERRFEDMRRRATADPDLAADPRLTVEMRKARSIKYVSRTAAVLQIALAVVFVAVGGWKGITALQAAFNPPPSTVELVDVTVVPPSIDFLRPITVDVTGGRISYLGPHDTRRGSHVPNFRSFEAQGKFLAEIDASRPDWAAQVAGATRPIDIGTAGDFLILDRDPRTDTITRDRVAGAVIGGKYLSRADVGRNLK